MGFWEPVQTVVVHLLSFIVRFCIGGEEDQEEVRRRGEEPDDDDGDDPPPLLLFLFRLKWTIMTGDGDDMEEGKGYR